MSTEQQWKPKDRSDLWAAIRKYSEAWDACDTKPEPDCNCEEALMRIVNADFSALCDEQKPPVGGPGVFDVMALHAAAGRAMRDACAAPPIVEHDPSQCQITCCGECVDVLQARMRATLSQTSTPTESAVTPEPDFASTVGVQMAESCPACDDDGEPCALCKFLPTPVGGGQQEGPYCTHCGAYLGVPREYNHYCGSATGWVALNDAGDRRFGNFDFYGIRPSGAPSPVVGGSTPIARTPSDEEIAGAEDLAAALLRSLTHTSSKEAGNE